jgi:hypothetical protein
MERENWVEVRSSRFVAGEKHDDVDTVSLGIGGVGPKLPSSCFYMQTTSPTHTSILCRAS